MSSARSAGTPAPNPYQGKVIARCRVGDRLGRGRTSHVFKAHYEPLEKDIALKILSGDLAGSAELRKSFRREAQAIARIDHEHIVKVIDVVEDQDCLCILMEMIPGETLADRIKDKGTLPPKKAARIACQMARALQAAHAEKIVHRDIKPANVILTKGSDQVKVVDFGLAGSSELANRAGTPMYMSPEACQGKRVDEKSDVYALGVCLYQMLTGELPFTGKSVKQILAAHVSKEPPPPSFVNADLGTEFDGILKKLLVKSKGYRPTAADLVKLLEPLFEDGLTGTKPDKRAGGSKRGGRGGARRTPSAEQKKSPVPIIAAVGIVLVIIVVAVLAMKGDKAPTTPDVGTQPVQPPTTTKPVIAAPPPTADAGQEAFGKAYDYAKTNPGKEQDCINRFQQVEEKFPGTAWAEKAKTQRERIEGEIARRDQQSQLEQKKKAELEAALESRKALTAAVEEFAWGRAASIAAQLENLPTESFPAWQARQRRLQYLADEFAKQLTAGLDGYQQPLNVVQPSAPGVREITAVKVDGLAWSDGSLTGLVKWSEVKGRQQGIFNLAKKVISQSDAEGNAFLAILAAELWPKEGEKHKTSKMFREMIELTDDARGIGADLQRRYFSER